jgi:hypothetical protein
VLYHEGRCLGGGVIEEVNAEARDLRAHPVTAAAASAGGRARQNSPNSRIQT